MEAGSLKNRLAQIANSTNTQSVRTARSKATAPSASRESLQSIVTELSSTLRANKSASNQETISLQEATETAERIAERLKASGSAFGKSATIFQELSPERAQVLLL